jgi:hypothetical protein
MKLIFFNEVIMKNIWLVFLFIIAASCERSPFETTDTGNNPDVNLNQPFQLKVGESINLIPDNLKIGFNNVLSDSRCPVGVVCFWEGEADINIWLLKNRTDTIHSILKIRGYVGIQDSIRHKYIDTVGYRITLMQLDPYPHHPIPNDFSIYKAALNVSRLR